MLAQSLKANDGKSQKSEHKHDGGKGNDAWPSAGFSSFIRHLIGGFECEDAKNQVICIFKVIRMRGYLDTKRKAFFIET
jgi:hypothetical protein